MLSEIGSYMCDIADYLLLQSTIFDVEANVTVLKLTGP